MNKRTLKQITVMGISVRTTNENMQAATDIGNLWNQFMSEGIMDKIPNKVNNNIYSIYTNYEGDHTKPYTTILGCEVTDTSNVPNGMEHKTIEAGNYAEFTCKGDLTKGAVFEEWQKIWATPMDRLHTTDFEVYGEKAQNPNDAEVDIFIAIK